MLTITPPTSNVANSRMEMTLLITTFGVLPTSWFYTQFLSPFAPIPDLFLALLYPPLLKISTEVFSVFLSSEVWKEDFPSPSLFTVFLKNSRHYHFLSNKVYNPVSDFIQRIIIYFSLITSAYPFDPFYFLHFLHSQSSKISIFSLSLLSIVHVSHSTTIQHTLYLHFSFPVFCYNTFQIFVFFNMYFLIIVTFSLY